MNPRIKRVGITLVSLIVLAVAIGLILPTGYSLSRSLIIHAKPKTIHIYIGDLTKWDLWAPWKDEDPTVVTTFGERTSGVGASQSWIAKEGNGSLTIRLSSPTKGIEYDLFLDGGT